MLYYICFVFSSIKEKKGFFLLYINLLVTWSNFESSIFVTFSAI